MTDLSADLFKRITAHMDDDAFVALYSPDGLARTAEWECEDQWIVSYTTTRIHHGKLDGMFAVFVYEPYGKGARSENATQWRRVKIEKCKTRREARERAEHHYYKHCPKKAAKHGVVIS